MNAMASRTNHTNSIVTLEVVMKHGIAITAISMLDFSLKRLTDAMKL